MDTVIEFAPAYNVGSVRFAARVIVAFAGYDEYAFKFTHPFFARSAYKAAERFTRLVERGYTPWLAYELAKDGECPTLNSFVLKFEMSAHNSDNNSNLYVVDCYEGEGELITDWLATDYAFSMKLDPCAEVDETDLYQFYAKHFADFMPMPRYLNTIAQRIDELLFMPSPQPTEDFEISHHAGNYSY